MVSNVSRPKALEFALAGERAPDDSTVRLEVLSAVKVHHVVQVARTLTLCQCSHLLREYFFERVAKYIDTASRTVSVWVVDRTLNRCQHQHLVCCQVELNARWIACAAEWAAVADATLCRLTATRIGENLKLSCLWRKL